MVSRSVVNRLIATAGDFDVTGLRIIGYYLRLYAIEVILGDEEGTAEFMGQVTDLMECVEEYKQGVEGDGSVGELIRDQEKARTYVLNFAMSLYNGKLKQIQDGPWDYTLQRGLWCCIDLFSCVLKLWDDRDGSLEKRIKYCKVYLTKLARGELGDTPSATAAAAAVARQESEGSSVQEPESSSDDEISAMLKKLRTADSENEPDESISLPQAPSITPGRDVLPEAPSIKPGDGPASEPKFIDSEPEDQVPEKHKGTENRRFTQDQLRSIMEKSSQIEKVQKLAKYAISALNYDDIATAKDELIKALEILNALE
ncbi:hypothetical protein HG537_0B00780 [Torulaspora globosa]|uniref:Vacuolar protein sorting-associated protein VTA1 n=1 Tax=Torulaspora globosa TaxID=48254 RepID=A0A7H9HN99_9SACH|nr:hypothetical protein HG537_0B00780 [Torulaspora sp. CBS 2947]